MNKCQSTSITKTLFFHMYKILYYDIEKSKQILEWFDIGKSGPIIENILNSWKTLKIYLTYRIIG